MYLFQIQDQTKKLDGHRVSERNKKRQTSEKRERGQKKKKKRNNRMKETPDR